MTGLWTLPFAAYFGLLSTRVSLQRLEHKKLIGDRTTVSTGEGTEHDPDPLYLAIRAHANFVEHVPLALIFATVAELNGANRRLLNWTLGALLVMRIAHVELGLKEKGTEGLGRKIGAPVTNLILGGLAGYSAYLVKGYWGF